MSDKINTHFASKEKASSDEFNRQLEIIANSQSTLNILNLLPLLVVVLNKNRQIVYANNEFKNLMTAINNKNYINQRLGEAIKCIHVKEKECECGTTEACKICGANNAILYAQRLNEKGIDECRIEMENNEVMDLLIWASPLELEGEYFTVCSMKDLEGEKRREALERIFFHDVLNTVGGLKGFVGLLPTASDQELRNYHSTITRITDKLIDEIEAQRMLLHAENGELELNLQKFSTYELLSGVKMIYEKHEITKHRKIMIEKKSADIVVENDKTIVRRVIGNLVKNALEAISNEEEVTLGCFDEGDKYTFRIHNNSVMSQSTKLQLFKRSFSTKGNGRGLGTYSVKLLTEKYLNGKVTFESKKDKGTTFEITFYKKLES